MATDVVLFLVASLGLGYWLSVWVRGYAQSRGVLDVPDERGSHQVAALRDRKHDRRLETQTPSTRQKVCIVVSSVWPLQNFLFDQLSRLSEHYDVLVVANTDDKNFLTKLGLDVELVPVRIEQNFHLRDFVAMLALLKLFREKRFAAVHSFSPKGGLLAMAASSLARVPVRVHTFAGQAWITRKGFARRLLRETDWLIGYLATHIFVDSVSQREFLIEENIIDPGKSSVLAKGSLSGVDPRRFRPDALARARIRRGEKISELDFVFLYIGRLSKDKGLLELASAFSRVCACHARARLLIVGPDEEGMRQKMLEVGETCRDKIHFVDYTKVPEQYMAAADVLCLPSYSEGFGSVIIEAAAVGIPAIGSRIYGVTDAIQEGETGLLHEAANVDALYNAMVTMIGDASLRKAMGDKARQRVLQDFKMSDVSSALLDYYSTVLNANRDPYVVTFTVKREQR